jgi:hypothetical protein
MVRPENLTKCFGSRTVNSLDVDGNQGIPRHYLVKSQTCQILKKAKNNQSKRCICPDIQPSPACFVNRLGLEKPEGAIPTVDGKDGVRDFVSRPRHRGTSP